MKFEHKDRYVLLGLNISYYRKLAGFTQDTFAERLGMDVSHISKVETAKVGVSLDALFDIADALEIPIGKLFDFRD